MGEIWVDLQGKWRMRCLNDYTSLYTCMKFSKNIKNPWDINIRLSVQRSMLPGYLIVPSCDPFGASLSTHREHLSRIFCQSFLLHSQQHTHNGLCRTHGRSSAEGFCLHPVFPLLCPWSRGGHLSSRSLLAEEYPAPHIPRKYFSLG